MTDETINRLKEVENESSGDVHLIGDIMDTESKMNTLGVIEKAMKLEHEERKLRLEEAKQKLEADKFKYQKEHDKKDNRAKVIVACVTGGGTALVGIAKIVQVCIQRKYIKEAYAIDQVTTLTSPTARSLLKDGTNPRL